MTKTTIKRELSALRRKRVTRTITAPCRRCGGVGRSDAWRHTGYICYRCGGSNSRHYEVVKVRVYQDPALAARDAELEQALRDIEATEYEAARRAREAEYEAARQAREAALRAERAASRHLGQVGEKITVRGEVVVAMSFEGSWNRSASRLLVVRTAEGNKVKTFGSGRSLFGIEKGQQIELAGKVKEHEVYNDEKVTVLSHVKVKEEA